MKTYSVSLDDHIVDFLLFVQRRIGLFLANIGRHLEGKSSFSSEKPLSNPVKCNNKQPSAADFSRLQQHV